MPGFRHPEERLISARLCMAGFNVAFSSCKVFLENCMKNIKRYPTDPTGGAIRKQPECHLGDFKRGFVPQQAIS